MMIRHSRGFTLIELMISLVIGVILMAGIVTLFVSSRRSFDVDSNVARMQNEARFAIRELSRDLSMASYVAEPLAPGAIDMDASLAVGTDCGPAGVVNWIYRMAVPGAVPGTEDLDTLVALDNATGADANDAFGCIDADEVVAGNDLVAIKRVAGDGMDDDDVVAGQSYIRSNGTMGLLYVEPATGAVAGTTRNWTYRPHIYFVRNYADTEGDGIPTLCRKSLASGVPPSIVTECVARGVESLQLEYGIDTDGDGNANRYVADPAVDEIELVASARVFVLVRSPSADLAYEDTRTYTVSNAGDFTPPACDPVTYDDPRDDPCHYHRRLYSMTLTVHNLRNLRRLGIPL